MTGSIDEDTVDFKPNYDSRELEPVVLPAALPNLLVNGASGIAVGMATNMAPHNLVEVVQALRHLVTHPTADLDALMRFVPGPDLPTGGKIIGLAGIRDAYATGRGTFKMRATTRIESVTPRRKGIVVTELPYGVGPGEGDRAHQAARPDQEAPGHRRRQGPHRPRARPAPGHRGQERLQPRGDPRPALPQTPMEDSFGINNVALVDGQPRTLGLKQLLEVFLGHRYDVVRRSSPTGAARPPTGCTWSRAC